MEANASRCPAIAMAHLLTSVYLLHLHEGPLTNQERKRNNSIKGRKQAHSQELISLISLQTLSHRSHHPGAAVAQR